MDDLTPFWRSLWQRVVEQVIVWSITLLVLAVLIAALWGIGMVMKW